MIHKFASLHWVTQKSDLTHSVVENKYEADRNASNVVLLVKDYPTL